MKDKLLDFLISGHGVMSVLALIAALIIYFVMEPGYKMYALLAFASEVPILLSYYWLYRKDD